MTLRPGDKPGAFPAAGRVSTARGARPDGSGVHAAVRRARPPFHAPPGPPGREAAYHPVCQIAHTRWGGYVCHARPACFLGTGHLGR